MSEQETMHETMAPAKLGKEHEMLAKSAGEWNVTMHLIKNFLEI